MKTPILPAGMQPTIKRIKIKPQQSGFTLLEIIVVMMIVGILSGIAITHVRFDSSDDKFQQRIALFAAFYRGAQDEAILSQSLIRLDVQSTENGDTLQPQRYVDNSWQDFSLGQGHKTLTISDDLTRTTVANAIMLYPNGQSSLFKVTFTQLGNNKSTQQKSLYSDAFGRLSDNKLANELSTINDLGKPIESK